MKKYILFFLLFSCSSEESRQADTYYKNKNYKKAIELYTESLKLKPNDSVAIEDSQESLNSAKRAKIKCIIFPGKFHSSKKFIGAYKKVYRLNKNIILR